MNILDENIAQEQREFLKRWRIPVRHIGYDLGRASMKDDEIIPLLHQLPRPTLFTRDIDFYKHRLRHAHYCLVFMAVSPNEVAQYARRFLRHRQFNTQAKRMGTVVRVSQPGLTVLRLHAEQEISFTWD